MEYSLWYRGILLLCVAGVHQNLKLNKKIVEEFNKNNKRSVLLQSEGVFVNDKHWYGGAAPKARFCCLWGPKHLQIFKNRGYTGIARVTGPPRFDIYRNFVPRLSKQEVYSKIGLEDIDKPYIVYLGQYFNEVEWGPELFQGQKDLTDFACQTPDQFYGVVKCHPQETKNFFSRFEYCRRSNKSNIHVIDYGGHSESVEITTLLSYAAAAVSFSSTASIEAGMLGVPTFVFPSGEISPLRTGIVASLPELQSMADLISRIANNEAASGFDNLLSSFLPGEISGKFAENAASQIACYLNGTLELSEGIT